MRFINYFLGILLLITSLFSSNASPFFSIKAEVDQSLITIGDPITYSVTIQFDKSLRVKKPGPGFGLGEFEIRDYKLDVSTVEANGLVTEKVHYVLSIYETGTFFIPAAQAAALIGGKEVEIRSDLIKIEVQPSETNANAMLRDIKEEVLPKGYTPLRYYLYMVIPFLLAGLVWLVYWLIQKRRARLKSLIPDYIEAGLALKKLNEDKLDEREFYYGLSNIVRRYWERSLKVPCLTLATVQILERFKELDYPHLSFATEFLRYSDRVKFAKHQPEKEKTSTFLGKFENMLLQAKEKADLKERARLEAKLSK